MQVTAVTAFYDEAAGISRISIPARVPVPAKLLLLLNGQVLPQADLQRSGQYLYVAGDLSGDVLEIVYSIDTSTCVSIPPSIWPITPIEFLPPDPAGDLPSWTRTTDPPVDLSAAYQPLDLKLSCLDYNVFDLALNTSLDLATDSSLDTAIVISLFTDRYDRQSQQGGWWGDNYVDSPNTLGSRLWLLNKSKIDVQTLRNAENYAREALQWLLDDKLLTDLTINCQWGRGDTNTYHLRLFISAIYQPNTHYRSSLTRSYLL